VLFWELFVWRKSLPDATVMALTRRKKIARRGGNEANDDDQRGEPGHQDSPPGGNVAQDRVGEGEPVGGDANPVNNGKRKSWLFHWDDADTHAHYGTFVTDRCHTRSPVTLVARHGNCPGCCLGIIWRKCLLAIWRKAWACRSWRSCRQRLGILRYHTSGCLNLTLSP
jgi:hypothetical protein